MAVFDTKAIGPEQAYEQAEATPAWVQTGAREYRHPSYWAGLVIVGDAR